MKRFGVLVLVLALVLPLSAQAQATPENTRHDRWVVGDALTLFPASRFEGTNGVLIVGEVPYDYGTRLAVVIQTGQSPVHDVTVVVTAKTPDGQLFAVGDSGYPGIAPASILPGGIGFGVVTFEDVSLPENVTLTAEWSADTDPSSTSWVNAEITQQRYIDNRIVGEVKNPTDETVLTPALELMCFSTAGKATYRQSTYAPGGDLAAGATRAFQIDIDDGADCSQFLLASYSI